MEIKGVDVSTYNGVIDWTKVKATGYSFAILKIINKSLAKDSKFEANWTGCTNAEVTIQGVYNYSYATTTAKAVQDANAVVGALNGRKTMVWLDVEDNVQKNLGQRLVDIINTYQSVIEAAGLSFGVYTGLSFYNSYIESYRAQIDYPFWIARYGKNNGSKVDSNKPSIVHTLCGWQYTSKGAVNGISGAVDLNVFYQNENTGDAMEITYPTIRKGSKGAYVTLLQQRLAAKGYSCGTIDGIFGVRTLEAVKALQVENNLQVDGIVGPETWAKVVA
ncbi:MAG: GH25 family lysozyme [Lachnospiraceae bacterium]